MILITAKVHEHLINSFTKKGYVINYEPNITYTELLQKIPHVTGLLVTTRLAIDKQIIDAGKNLQWIGRLGSGMELIDVPYANSKNIICISSPEGNCNAVAEQTLGMMLCMKNNIIKACNEVKNGEWIRDENRGSEIMGSTIGIIGYGNTGAAFAKLLQHFNATVLVYDKYKKGFGNAYIVESTMAEICKKASVISFHVPLSSYTKNMVDDNFFELVENKPLLINTSRGNVINTSSLIKAIKSNTISGAALDVIENEKLETLTQEQKVAFNFLINQPNVLITPHIAGYSNEAFFKMADIILQKLMKLKLIV